MVDSKGNICYTVSELIEELQQFKGTEKVMVIGRDSANVFFTKPFYKIECAADNSEIYLYT